MTKRSNGGLAVLAKYGREHFITLGKRGFQKTCNLYFGGNRKSAACWLYEGKGTIKSDYGLAEELKRELPAGKVIS